MNINDMSGLMQLLMMQSASSIGGSGLGNEGMGGNSSMIFELMLMSMLNDSQSSSNCGCKCHCNENTDTVNNINARENTTNNQYSKGNGSLIPGSIDEAIEIASKKYGIEKEFIKAVIAQESSFNPNAVSRAGAQGLMQLMPGTANSLGVKNPFNALENIDAGTRYLKGLMGSYNGSKELALAAYNGGSGRMKRRGVDTVDEIYRMPNETVKYVDKVMRNYYKYKGNV